MADHGVVMAAFARRIGLPDAANAGENPAVFDLEGLGQLTLEAAEERGDFMMSLAVPLPPYDDERLLAALRLCHPDRVRPFPLSCGLHRDHLIFMSRQPCDDLTAAALENQAIFLIDSAKAAGF
jgi:type III secretion system chaperone SycN